MPCVPFTLAAGFLYGTFIGSIIVSVASTIAAVVAFLAARYLARNWIESQLAMGGKTSKFRIIDNAIQQDGFRIVLLIRSSPLHPYGVCNYLFGLTSVTVRDYTVASFIGMLPTTVMEVYFGTAIQNVADILSGNLHNSVLSRVFFYAGLILSIAATAALTIRLKRMLRTELDKYQTVAQNEGDIEDDALHDDDDSFFGAVVPTVRSSPGVRDTAIELVSDLDTRTDSTSRISPDSTRRNSDPRRGLVIDAHSTNPSAAAPVSSRRAKSVINNGNSGSTAALHAALGPLPSTNANNHISTHTTPTTTSSISSISSVKPAGNSPHKQQIDSVSLHLHPIPHPPVTALIDEEESLEEQALIPTER
jgi:uncharacterized membrane protein YdjX (TVP38/TMEM64 family)